MSSDPIFIAEHPAEELSWDIEQAEAIRAGDYPALKDLNLQNLDHFLETALTQILFAIVKLPDGSPVRPHLVNCCQCLERARQTCRHLLHNAGV